MQTAVTKAIPASVAQVNQHYYACASNADIEFFDISSGMCVSSIQIISSGIDHQQQERYTSFAVSQYAQPPEQLISMMIVPVQNNDTSKKYLFAGGAGRSIHMYKVDTLLKCASMPMTRFETNHENTITGLAYFYLSDGSHYLCSTSIDR